MVRANRKSKGVNYGIIEPASMFMVGPEMKVREVINQLEQDGWRLIRTRGSHRQFKHPTKAGTVTVSGKSSLDVPPGTLNSILKQAGMK